MIFAVELKFNMLCIIMLLVIDTGRFGILFRIGVNLFNKVVLYTQYFHVWVTP